MKKWFPGDPLSAERLNALQRAVPGNVRLGGGLVGSRSGNNLCIARDLARPGDAAPAEVRRFKVTAVHDDYLECVLVDGDGTAYASATANVAKPNALRDPDDETYSTDDIILAVRPVWGGTGVDVADVPLVWEAVSPTTTGGGGGGPPWAMTTTRLATSGSYVSGDVILSLPATVGASALCLCQGVYGASIKLYADTAKIGEAGTSFDGAISLAIPAVRIPDDNNTYSTLYLKAGAAITVYGDDSVPGATFLSSFAGT